MAVEAERVRKLNPAGHRGAGARYVLYWAQMNRRVDSNHALLYAVELGNALNLPILYYEALTCSYPGANDRLSTFILEGVPDTAERLKQLGIGYVFYLRRRPQEPNDVLYRLAREAAAVVTDDFPAFIARRHNAQVPERLDVSYYAVDSSCIVPASALSKREYGAYTIRPKLRKLLPAYLKPADPVRVKKRWRYRLPQDWHTVITRDNVAELIATCQVDHSIGPSLTFIGGRAHAVLLLRRFLTNNLKRYAHSRNEPAEHATSNLSPYLHFGHISALEVALAAEDYAADHEFSAAEFLDELITWRELAFNHARFVEHPERIENLPAWCQKTMRQHANDPRRPCYSAAQLLNAGTHDELWNATQKEMLLRGQIHGYYRMYWGKKIVEWSKTYQSAVDTMLGIHDRYALDGRDPNTYAGVLWCLGLHDRPWFERPVFGAIRYMSQEGMRRKTNTQAYIEEISDLERTGKDPYKVTL
jgi:deoxyribodipyrimidine photo-lyase